MKGFTLKCILITAIVISVMASQGTCTKDSTLKNEDKDHSVHKRSQPKQYDNDSRHHDKESQKLILMIALPTIVVIALIVIIAIIVCIVYRTHFSYGSIMCCHTPKRHPTVGYQQSLGEDVDVHVIMEEERSPSPPDYSSTRSLSPPVYSDAINDVLLLKGVDSSSVSLPSYHPPCGNNHTAGLNTTDNLHHSTDTQSHTEHGQLQDHIRLDSNSVSLETADQALLLESS